MTSFLIIEEDLANHIAHLRAFLDYRDTIRAHESGTPRLRTNIEQDIAAQDHLALSMSSPLFGVRARRATVDDQAHPEPQSLIALETTLVLSPNRPRSCSEPALTVDNRLIRISNNEIPGTQAGPKTTSFSPKNTWQRVKRTIRGSFSKSKDGEG